jgi:hypothetical protein
MMNDPVVTKYGYSYERMHFTRFAVPLHPRR